jgi:hypothetical protein
MAKTIGMVVVAAFAASVSAEAPMRHRRKFPLQPQRA